MINITILPCTTVISVHICVGYKRRLQHMCRLNRLTYRHNLGLSIYLTTYCCNKITNCNMSLNRYIFTHILYDKYKVK